MVCLDLEVLINFLRKDPLAFKIIKSLRSQRKELKITSINSFELLKGILRDSKMDKLKVVDFLNNFKILDFEFDSSKKAAEIFEDLKSREEIIGLADVMIASIVIENGEKLITGNSSHFKRIKRLIFESGRF